jgi:hypothetical protein
MSIYEAINDDIRLEVFPTVSNERLN